MTTYQVQILRTAEEAIFHQARYIAADSPSNASKWLGKMWHAISALALFPHRNPVASLESEIIGTEVRRLVIGNHIAYYHNDENRLLVEVWSFRHAATSKDIDSVKHDRH
ncbi:MAG: type II toxin-antitoxin system RelE/ParE family toxin [Phycisphaerae bacterium]